MDLKLYALKFKVGKCITRVFFKIFKKLKSNLIINLNILPKVFITKKSLHLKKGHHNDDDSQQSNITI
jgi:hypothetical protein